MGTARRFCLPGSDESVESETGSCDGGICQFLGIEPDRVRIQHHRLEMYTDRSEDGSLIPLEAMGVDMTGDEEWEETDETKSFDREKRKSCITFFLEEDQIAEIHCAKSDEQEKVHQIGDIYVAKVQNIVQI